MEAGGNAYGVVLHLTSGDNILEDNIFEHLRHSMLLQAGVNGNVLAYNYSTDPFKTEFFGLFTTDQTGDLVCHGNYPYANLFEGNIASYGIIDASHGANGPYNHYFRNHMGLYGMQISDSSPDSDNQTIVGNEAITYSLAESGHYEYGNNVNGTITPAGTGNLTQDSYFRNSAPAYFDQLPWPSVGNANSYGVGTIPAEQRFLAGGKLTADCMDYTSCPDTLSIETLSMDSTTFQANDHIISTTTVFPLQSIILQAEQCVEVNPGAEIQLGGEFEIRIDSCSN